ncbi:hypothetical protein GCM10023224_40450 [Streptomonospora halophila]|uniref:DUF397 domain-containing protein n=1 Tax=Streptomonospora halophila TaxID=427369 RepID=A0ABP9H076_9ACTN
MERWTKSSYSNGTGANCVEVAWRKSTYSTGGANCVEVATPTPSVLVRDTQHRPLGHLDFPASEWAAFLTAARAAEL